MQILAGRTPRLGAVVSPRMDNETIEAAFTTGDRVRTLVAMGKKLARDMDNAQPSVVAMISGQLRALTAELADIAPPEELTDFERIKRDRANRIANTNNAKFAG